MIACIHQPDFLPWLGFYDRWARCDLLVLLDDGQFLRRGWHHRDRLKTAAGAQWLTVPVLKKGRFTQTIAEVELEPGAGWRQKHLSMIRHAYCKAKAFREVFAMLEEAYAMPCTSLRDLNVALLRKTAALLGLYTPTVFSSELGVSGARTERLVDICRRVGADTYLSGMGARSYLDEELFREAGIDVLWREYDTPRYPQLHGDFIPGLSVVDFLMNCGPTPPREMW